MIVTDVNDDPNGFICHSRFCLLLDCTRSHLDESFIFTTRIAAAATAVAAAAATATAKAAATLTLIARNRNSKFVQDGVETFESPRAVTIDSAQSIESMQVVAVDVTLGLLGSVGWIW
jgi:outer membrane receptor protein involved in Fe transport